MNKTCTNCKHWIKHFYDTPDIYNHICGKLNSSGYKADGCGSYELIATGPDFGCIHWETNSDKEL